MEKLRYLLPRIVAFIVLIIIGGCIGIWLGPQILKNIQNPNRDPRLADAVYALEQAWYHLKETKTYHSDDSLYNNLVPNLKITSSSTDAPPGGCNGGVLYNYRVGPYYGYVEFPNGVIVSGLYGGPGLHGMPSSFPNIPSDLNTNEINYILCFDVNGAEGPNQPGQDVFFANFNSSGDFDGKTPPSTDNKNFFYGSISQHVYDTLGTGNTWGGTPPAPDGFAAAGSKL